MKLVVDFILIFGIVLNILALFGLIRIKNKKLPQWILIVFWIATLNVFLFFYASLHQLHYLKSISYIFENGVRFFVPPLVYLYIQSIFDQRKNLIRKNLVHFIPFILFLILYNLPKAIGFRLVHTQILDDYLNWGLIQDVYGTIYFGLALKLFYSLKRKLIHHYANLSTEDFFWIEKFLFSFLIVLVIDLIITLNEMYFAYSVFWDGYITVFFLLCAMLYIGYYGLTQSTIFLPSFLVHGSALVMSKRVKPNYFEVHEIDNYKDKFITLMEVDKVYLEKDLSLTILADRMSVSPRKLSAFFNEILGSSFYESINYYRVEEAKKKLSASTHQNYTITGIGLSCGFKSKSSFYRIFKKATSSSPLTYIANTSKQSQNKQ